MHYFLETLAFERAVMTYRFLDMVMIVTDPVVFNANAFHTTSLIARPKISMADLN